MICDLTGMEIANSSLLDEGTAAAESMCMLLNTMSRAKRKQDLISFLFQNFVILKLLMY